jgi:hypothetical protein
MAGLDPAIVTAARASVRGTTRHDGRIKSGHDG